MVCAEGRGNTERFVCPYHGWSYDRAGTLQAVPFARAATRRTSCPNGLKAVPRVARLPRLHLRLARRRRATDLEEFLGPARASFDDFVDRAPGGELEVAGGVFKHAYNGNWKLMLENHLDGAHPAWVHASSVAVARNAPEPGKPGEEHYYDIAVRQMRQNGAPDAVWEATGMWTTPRGHGYMGDYHDDSRLVAGLGNPVFDEYRRSSSQEAGEDGGRPHPARHAVEHHRLPELLVHEPVPAAAHHPSARGRPLRGLHVLVPHEERAGADVPRHRRLRQRGERHRLVGADRRPRGLRAHPARAVLRRGRLGLHRPRPRPRRRRAERHAAAAPPAPARSSSARRCARGSTTCRHERRSSSCTTRRGSSTRSATRSGSSSSPTTPPTGCRSSGTRRIRSRPPRSSTTTARCSSCA